MTISQLSALLAVTLALNVVQPGHAIAAEPLYDMNSTSTFIWDHDVEYFSPPILLRRNSTTWDLHWVEFNVLRYEPYCVSWQQVCVAWDNHGRCIRWENRCVQVDYREWPVGRRIEINTRGLPDLANGQEETYRLEIRREKPFGAGEDRVYTWLEGVNTIIPVKVLKLGEFNYRVDPK